MAHKTGRPIPRDAKFNLIVISVVIALMIPGGVILVRKKSMPGERAIGSPDPVRTTTAWIDPYPGPAVTRLAPLRTLQWLGALSLDNTPGDDATRIVRAAPTPVVSDDKLTKTPGNVGEALFYGQQPAGSVAAQVISPSCWFQALSRGDGPTPWTRIVVFDDDKSLGPTFRAEQNGVPAQLLSAKVVDVPIEVRHDLQEAGYVMPPKSVWLIDIGGAGKTLKLSAGTRADTLALP